MSYIVEWYRDVIDNKYVTLYIKTLIDPRTQEWFLVPSPGPILTITATYIYFCVSAGPRYMKDKKPYDLRSILIIYNFIQVLISLYLVYEGLMAGWLYEYNFICQPVDYSYKPSSVRMANGVYLYFLCKLIELLDTVFFVLRKKDRQITFLHLFHHSLMPFCAWIGVKFVAGGHPTLLGIINSFVHIFMYTYYMLAAFGPYMQKLLFYLQKFQFYLFCNYTFQASFWFTKFNYFCEPIDYSDTPKARQITILVWDYFMLKLLDLMDTIFFVLRKRQNQITFLHLYHHIGILIAAWGAVKWLPGGHIAFLGFFNTFVHIIMYTHYLLASMKINTSLWKKHITQLQLVQFFVITLHYLQLTWVENCGFPLWPIYVMVPQNLFMIMLFGDFYYKTYMKKKPTIETKMEIDSISTEFSNGKLKEQ
ncbi:Elongation of very long chain fatty acids protein 7 [Atta colombica]|uniref:Elongation of very long chain fatty acids protein n=1 Tax=Atta colombica TaxID=520822 RepID=A0A151I3W1_9HYME|nr:Elongation of very long chain fatty acids protein 7 [Atta colombica]